MPTARQRVLAHLEKQQRVSVADISRALKMSEETVRHHLRILVRDGRALRASASGRGTRGRPAQVYESARAAHADNLAALASALLDEAGPAVRPDAIARRLLGPRDSSAGSGVRLAALIEKLNAMEYQSRWEAGAEGPRIVFGHCPYAKIIEAHPELCAIDEALLARRLGRGMKQTAKLEPDLRGIKHCVFVSR